MKAILVVVAFVSLPLPRFPQRSNDLFLARVAGNGVGSACLGSLRYAVAHFQRGREVQRIERAERRRERFRSPDLSVGRCEALGDEVL